LEAGSIFKSHNSTFYRLDIDNMKGENILVSIPQSSNPGWFAIGKVKDGFFKILSKDSRVMLNGWKQGWDISDIDYEYVTILYWPNLLSYFGYFAILFLFIYIPIKISKQRKYVLY